MLRNFLKTATRNILKYKAYSVINFIGLTSGLALALLIITYVRSELSYDQFHEKKDRLYRMSYSVPNGLQLASTPPPIAPVLTEYFPDVEATARVYGRNVSITRPNETEAYEESGVFFADATLFDMFTFDFVKGNPALALKEKFTVIINEEMAKKYFGDANPIGESLVLAGRQSFKVTAVVKDFPENSHFRFNMLVPYDNMFDLETEQTAQILRKNLEINFIISHSYTYVLLKPGTNPQTINTGMEAFIKKYAQPRFVIGQVFSLMPVTDIHLKSTLLAEPTPTNDMTNIFIFAGVGILTLIIACINYINLSTAQSFTRIKEIGVRKILGSMRYQLISQFLAESFLFVLISMIMAYLVFDLTLPLLNLLTNKNMLFVDVVDQTLIFASAILLLVITLLAGGYPAYFITQFESVAALKGSSVPGQGNQFLRKVLVVFQLTIACLLLSGSLLILKQMNYLSTKPLGFQREQILNIPLYSQNLNGVFRQTDSTFRSRLEAFRQSIETQSGIAYTTLSSGAPGLGVTYRGTIPDGFTQEDNLFVANMSVDYDFLQAYNMELVTGRGFGREFPADETNAFLVNETAVKEFNWDTPEKAIGKKMNREGKEGIVVGVVKDFNFASLTTPISSMVIELDPNQFGVLSIKLTNADVQKNIKQIESTWNELFPEKAFEYTFLDEQLNQQYANFQNFSSIIQCFTIIGILIACLGVYGLVLFTVQRKVKEIGVRKVLGATIGNVLTFIFRDFALLLVTGFVFAIPISYYLLNKWLTNFTYHTSIDVFTYVISFSIIGLVVVLTVSYQAIRAAQANPVRSLRSE